MRKPIILLIAVAAIALLICGLAAAAPGVVKDDYKQIMPLSEVRAGMKGHGLTVFKGTKIEKFDVEVVGILRKVNNGKDWIMVKMAGGPITARGANIIQGMSGSPVYINGRIIGAVAYGPGSFSKEPIGMLTPIEDMLDSLDPKLPARPAGLSSDPRALSSPIKLGDETITHVEIRDRASSERAPKGTLIMTPLMTPLMVSGMSSKGIARLAEFLEPYGMSPMAGPGAKADEVPVSFTPGAAVGVSLATGDIDLTGIGTLTYRRGNKVIAFGHPMLNIGPIDAPMTTAYVHDVFPSLQISTKIASPMKIIGRISQDRPWSIGGEVWKFPTMIPMKIDIDNKVIGRKRTVNVKVINHPLLAPRLLLMMTAEALTETHGIPGDAMATAKLEIDADQVGKITRENAYFDPGSIEIGALDDFQAILNILTNNKFHSLDVKSVNMSVTIESGRKTAMVERIFIDKSKYEPGQTVKIGVEMLPYKAEKIVKTVEVKIPETTPDGNLMLQVRGGLGGGEGAMPMPMPMPQGADPKGPRAIMSPGGTAENIKQIIDKYLEREKNNELVARLMLPTPALSVAGEKLSQLPDSIAGVMRSPRSSTIKLERDDVKVVQPMDFIVVGEQTLTIRVERRQLAEKKQRPQMIEPPAQQPMVAPAPPVSETEDQTEEAGMEFSVSTPVSLAVPAAKTKEEKKPAAKSTEPAKSTASSNGKEAEKAGADSEKADDSAKKAEKTVVRQPSVWTQKTLQDFSGGSFSGTAATSEDDVRLAPSVVKLADLSETYVWKVVADGSGGVYAATGDNGIIYKIDKNGGSSVLLETGELEVHSMVRNSTGIVYAGTSPNGKVFKIQPGGSGEVVFDASEKYILALAVDSKDNVYAAAGDGGTIYRISSSGETSDFAKLPEASVLSLYIDGADNVYAGTGKTGVIYKIGQDGKMSAVYNASEDSISSLLVNGSGTVYAGTGSGKGNIYKIPASGAPKIVFDKAPRALSMTADAAGNIYVVSDEQIVKIAPDDTVTTLDTNRSGAQFISVAVDSNGTIFAGAANTAAVYRSAGTSGGTYESPVHDAGLPSRWGKISWVADIPQGAKVEFDTRTGNVAEPDATWSDWMPVQAGSTSIQVPSPSARYIQYRARVAGEAILKQVTVAYLTENRPPKLAISSPGAGDVLSRMQTIKWAGSDPDKDALIYDLYYSADSGKTWQSLGTAFKKKANGAAPADESKDEAGDESAAESEEEPVEVEETMGPAPDADELVSQLKAELDKHPEIPQDVKDKMLAEAPAAAEKAVAAAQSPDADADDEAEASEGNSTKQTSYNWDTTKVSDGSYLIKIAASDRISNATGFLTEEKIVGPMMVSNEAPKVYAFQKDVTVASDRTVKIDGYTYHQSVPIAGVQYKVNTGEWMAAAAVDGMFDSASEAYVVTTQPLAKGNHEIEVKAIDSAGNSATAKVTAEVK